MGLPGSITLQTRMGRSIENTQVAFDPGKKQTEVEAEDNSLSTSFPRARRRRPASGEYNCHGLTFATRRTGIKGRRAYNDVQTILADDGYSQIPSSLAQVGDVAMYYCKWGLPRHSGVVVDITSSNDENREIIIVSKWGDLGEYIHAVAQSSYCQYRVCFYTDRQ